MNNASFQTKLNSIPARGIAGQKLFTNPIVYYCKALRAEKDIPCSAFVWLSTDTSVEDTVINSGTGKPLGLCLPLALYANEDLLSSASNQITENNYLSVCIKGDLLVTCASVSKVGDKIFASLTDGSIKADKADATVTGFIETDFSVISAGSAGELITISNWSV